MGSEMCIRDSRKRKGRLKGNVPGPANPPTHTGSVPLPQKPSQREKAPQRQMRDGWGKRVRRLSTHHEMDADRPCCRQPACYQWYKSKDPRNGPHAQSYWLKPRPEPLGVQLEPLATTRGRSPTPTGYEMIQDSTFYIILISINKRPSQAFFPQSDTPNPRPSVTG